MKLCDIHIRDPFVLVHDGKYYLYGTYGPHSCDSELSRFEVHVSEDMENWSEPTPCFLPPAGFWGTMNFWAPEVHEWKGKFYLFATFKSETVHRGTAILVADTPMGPFVPHSDGAITPSDWECLDGTFYVDKQGKPYMVFCHEWAQVVDGEIWAVPLSEDLTRPDGEMTLLFRASEAEWAIDLKCEEMHGYVTDGPFLWRTPDGTLLCLWASISASGYAEGLAVSDNGEIDGHFNQLEPLFMKDGGHGMVFRALDGRLYLPLHQPNHYPDERPVFFPLNETENRLTIAE